MKPLLIAASAIALLGCSDDESPSTAKTTDCFASFKTDLDAEAAAEAAADADFEAQIEGGDNRDHPNSRGSEDIGVVFTSNITGDDLHDFRIGFRDLVETHGGRLGHSGDGCLTTSASL